MITLFDRLRLGYRSRIEAIRKEYPCTFQAFHEELQEKDYVGNLSMKVVSDFILHNIILDYEQAYDMFYSEYEYKAKWAEYVEDKMRYEAQLEMEGEDNE